MAEKLPVKPGRATNKLSLAGRARRLPPVEWLVSYLFGDDIFISYSRKDGVRYGEELAHRLSDAGYSVRMDLWETKPGKETPKKVMRALRRSRNLVVIATPCALQSPHVAEEVDYYKSARPDDMHIIPVFFGEEVPATLWFEQVEGVPWLGETVGALAAAKPSDPVINRIRASLRFTRRNRRLFNTSLVLLGVLLLLLGLSVGASVYAGVKLVEANLARLDAEIAEANARKQQQAAEDAGREAARQRADAEASKVYAERQTLKAESETLEARRQSRLAEAANTQRQAAERATEAARLLEQQARANAAEQQSIANSRRLSGQADRVLAERPDLSFLLSAAALSAHPERPTWEARRSLLTAFYAYQNLDALLHPPPGVNFQRLAVAADERTVITAGGLPESRIVFWDIVSRKPRFNYEVPGPVNGMALTPNRETLVTISHGRLTLWNVRDGSRRGVAAPAFGEEEFNFTAVAAARDGRTVVTNGKPGEVVLWDISDPARPREIAPRLRGSAGARVLSLAFSPDGKTLLAGGDVGGAPERRGIIMRWDTTDVRTPKPLAELEANEGLVSELVFDPSGNYLASVGVKPSVLLWDTGSNPLAWNAATINRQTLTGESDSTSHDVAFSPDRKRLAVVRGDGTLVAYDLEDLAEGGGLGAPDVIGRYGRGLTGALFDHGSGRLVSVDADAKLTFWRLDGRSSLVRAVRDHEVSVSSMAFTPDGRLLASGDTIGLVAVTNPAAPSSSQTLDRPGDAPALSLDFDPAGGALAAGYGDGVLALWERGADGRWGRREFPADDIPGTGPDAPEHAGVDNDNLKAGRLVWFVRFADRGRTLISVGPGSQVVFWDARNGLARPRLVPLPGGAGVRTRSAAATPDGRLLAVGYTDGSVRLLDTRAPARGWETLPGRHENWVSHLAFSRDGRWLASADDNDIVVLWQTGANAKECRRFRVTLDFPEPDFVSEIGALAFGPDGTTLALGASQKVVLLDVETGSALGSFDAAVDTIIASPSTPAATRSPPGATRLTPNPKARSLFSTSDPAPGPKPLAASPTAPSPPASFNSSRVTRRGRAVHRSRRARLRAAPPSPEVGVLMPATGGDFCLFAGDDLVLAGDERSGFRDVGV